jgi:hypothetical protein
MKTRARIDRRHFQTGKPAFAISITSAGEERSVIRPIATRAAKNGGAQRFIC